MPRSKKTKLWSSLRWLLLLPLPFLWCAFDHYGGLRFFENRTLNWRYQFRGEIDAPVKVVYVDVDTQAIKVLGERPWDRADFGSVAKVVLDQGHAKAVGFDFVFSDFGISKMVPHDELNKRNFAFGRITRSYPQIVLGAQYAGGDAYIEGGQRVFPLLRLGHRDPKKNDVPELPQYPLMGSFVDQAKQVRTWGTVGLIDVDYGYGGDAVPRWVPLFAQTSLPIFYHLSLQLALIDMGLDASAVRIHAESIDVVRPDGTLAISIPLREQQLLEVNWFSAWASSKNQHVSMADVLSGVESLKSQDPEDQKLANAFFSRFRGAVVLIGPVDPLLQDLSTTPFDDAPVPKVGLHGNLVKTIRSGLFVRRLSEPTSVAITFILTLVVATLAAAGGARGFVSKIGGVAVLLGYVFAAFYLFKSSQLVLPIAAPFGAAFTTSFCAVMWQLIDEEKQKGRIKGMFGTYLAPTVVDQMIESGKDPELGGHDAVITAYFSDIQSFSSFSEVLGSSKLTDLLNEYLTACTDIVQAEMGTLDKYIGDAVVAMFGAPVDAPDHAYRACVASQLVQLRIGELREKWRSEGDRWPQLVHNLRTRIGLNTGECMIGNMGSRTRFNYTMMGDNVNLAARMESGAKSWGVYTMCTEATKVACERHGGDRIVFRPLARIVVKGRSQAVPVYEILGLKENVTDQTRECVGIFEQALAKYYAQDWAGALALIEKSRELEPLQPGRAPGVSKNPSLRYLQIIAEWQANPPTPGWDGRYVMDEK
jgi:adenylate cyclase